MLTRTKENSLDQILPLSEEEKENFVPARLPEGVEKRVASDIKRVTARHQAILNLHISGATADEIAITVQLTAVRVRQVINSPLFQAAARKIRANMMRDTSVALAGMSSEATATVREIMRTSKNEGLRFKTAAFILEAAGAKAAEEHHHTFDFGDVAAEAMRLAEQRRNGSSSSSSSPNLSKSEENRSNRMGDEEVVDVTEESKEVDNPFLNGDGTESLLSPPPLSEADSESVEKEEEEDELTFARTETVEDLLRELEKI